MKHEKNRRDSPFKGKAKIKIKGKMNEDIEDILVKNETNDKKFNANATNQKQRNHIVNIINKQRDKNEQRLKQLMKDSEPKVPLKKLKIPKVNMAGADRNNITMKTLNTEDVTPLKSEEAAIFHQGFSNQQTNSIFRMSHEEKSIKGLKSNSHQDLQIT